MTKKRKSDFHLKDEIVPVEKLWTKKVVREFKDDTNWAKLRTKKDLKTGETYFDVLIGLKGKKAHAHIGFNLNNTLRFQQYRKITHSIERTVESQKHGFLEHKKVIVDEKAKGGKQLVFQLIMVGSSAEVIVKEFYLRPEVNFDKEKKAKKK